LGDLFIRSLEEIQPEIKGWLKTFEIRREEPVKINDGKGRIDLLLLDKTNKRAIIIENKVYHTPKDNPFETYRNHVKDNMGYEPKLMLVSLAPIDRSAYGRIPDDCILFTHLKYTDCVMRNKNEKLCNEEKYEILFNEFYANIQNLSPKMTEESLNFYCENYKQLFHANNLFQNVKDEYKNAFHKSNFEGMELNPINELNTNESDQWIYLRFKDNRTVILTIFPYYEHDGEKYIRIILELQEYDTMNSVETHEMPSEYQEIINPNLLKNGNWCHFAEQLIPIDKFLMPYELQEKLKYEIKNLKIYNLGLYIVKNVLKRD
jgi:hypothetical protein